MQKDGSFLHDRNLWIYYALFFSGSLVVIYQAFSWNLVGDSVNFLCVLFLLHGLHVRRLVNIFENALLVTTGYILPLLIRNSIKLTYAEAPSLGDFAKLGLVSALTTITLGAVFTTVGFLLGHFGKKIMRLRKGRTTTSATTVDK